MERLSRKYLLIQDCVKANVERNLLSLGLLTKQVPTQVLLRGELLEALPEAEQPLDSSKIALFGIERKSLQLECALDCIMRLTEEDADLLLAIPSLEERYRIYMDKICFNFGKRIRQGSRVFVKRTVEGVSKKLPGVVRYKGKLPPGSDHGTMFGVELTKEHQGLGTTDGTFCNKRYFSCPLDSGVFVGLDKLLPRDGSEAEFLQKGKSQTLLGNIVRHLHVGLISGKLPIKRVMKANSVEEPASIILAAGESSKTDPSEFIEQQWQLLLDEQRSQPCVDKSEGADAAGQSGVDNPYGFEVGSMVEVPMAGVPRYGVIRWIGLISYALGKDKLAVGLELENELSSDGTFNGERYFTCPSGTGFFTLLIHCRPDGRFTHNSTGSDNAVYSDKEPSPSHFRERQQLPSLPEQFQEGREPEANVILRLRQADEQVGRLRRQLMRSEEELKNCQRQLRDKEEQLREKEQQQENSQRQLNEMEQQLANFERQISENEAGRANLERQLGVKDEQLTELETSLSAAQLTISELRRQETCDWVIARDEIQIKEKCLGKGGWGSVNEGTYCDCVVAVKQIHELILSPHNRRLFEREMNIASRCRHPCLLQFIGATNDEGSPLFVTELMKTSLRALLEQRELSEAEICVISLDVARALNYLHQRRPSPILHRDVSSANVLLWRQGDQWRGKVSDYGTAKFVQQTMTVAPGALIYSSPEALSSNQTAMVDVYSFGVLLCEMCIRELPDPERRDEQVVLVSNRMFRGLVRRCLETDPSMRPDMAQIIQELEQFNDTRS